MPSRKPASPMRLVMNAFLPARALSGSSNQKPISRYDARPDAFPADEQHEQRPAEHQQQHEEQEQVEVREVARVARVVLHVADRVDVDQRADAGDDQRHHGRQPVEVERDLERAAADVGPRVGDLDQRRAAAGRQVEEAFHGGDEGQDGQPAADHGHERLAEAVAGEAVDAGTPRAAAGRSAQGDGARVIPSGPRTRRGRASRLLPRRAAARSESRWRSRRRRRRRSGRRARRRRPCPSAARTSRGSG